MTHDAIIVRHYHSNLVLHANYSISEQMSYVDMIISICEGGRVHSLAGCTGYKAVSKQGHTRQKEGTEGT